MNIPTKLYEDEVVCFLADRYHTIPEKIWQCFFAQDSITSQERLPIETFRLEDNEMEILRDLVLGTHQ